MMDDASTAQRFVSTLQKCAAEGDWRAQDQDMARRTWQPMAPWQLPTSKQPDRSRSCCWSPMMPSGTGTSMQEVGQQSNLSVSSPRYPPSVWRTMQLVWGFARLFGRCETLSRHP